MHCLWGGGPDRNLHRKVLIMFLYYSGMCICSCFVLGGEPDRNIHRKFLILFWYYSAVYICSFVTRRGKRSKPTSQVFDTVRRAVVPEPSTNKTNSRPHSSHSNLLTPNFATNHNSPFPFSLTFDHLNQLSKILKTELDSKYGLNRKDYTSPDING